MTSDERPERVLIASAARGEKLPAYVSEASGDTVRVRNAGLPLREALSRFRPKRNLDRSLRIHVGTETEKAELFRFLRDRDVCFSVGREWCPKEVFEHLIDAGLLAPPFREIAWTGWHEWSVYERY